VLAAGQRAAHVIYVLTGCLRGTDMADGHVERLYHQGDILGADKFLVRVCVTPYLS
jgi:hypothetical protein